MGHFVSSVDEARIGGICRLNPWTGCICSRAIQGDGNDGQALVLQLFVKCLPTWQLSPASSPRRPGRHKDLGSTVVSQGMIAPFKIRKDEVRRF